MMRLLEERSSDTKSIYIYEQGGYVPLARIDAPNEDWYATEGLLLPKDINAIYYFHNNASGQPEEVTDRDGNVVWRGRYSAWGQLLYEEAPRGFVQNLRYQGQYHDREIGLHYNTFRYYDADTGRFTTEDPIGLIGGVNLYQYAPNPIAWIDPWGWENFKQDSPYHGRKPIYKNDGHHNLKGGKFRGGGSKTTPLPNDAEAVYKKAIPGDSKGKTWYGRNGNGDIYRYQTDNQGNAHFNGSKNSPRGLKDIPPDIEKRFKAMDKADKAKSKGTGCPPK